jgi:hypothetical protein
MASALFAHPIYLRNEHYIQELACLEDAFDYLEEWPEERRDLVYETTLRACREAYSGRFPLAAAEETLRRFARKRGILCDIEDMPNFLAGRSGRNLSGT